MSITTSSGERFDALENFIGGIPNEYVENTKLAMNDNAPPSPGNTVPNIAGGLSTPPKPANDNSNRPYPIKKLINVNNEDAAEEDYQKNMEDVYDYIIHNPQFSKFMMTKSGDLENVEPSKNIEHRDSSYNYTNAEVLKDILTAPMNLKQGGPLRKDIGLKDLDKRLQEGIDKTKLREYGKGLEGQVRFKIPELADERKPK